MKKVWNYPQIIKIGIVNGTKTGASHPNEQSIGNPPRNVGPTTS